MKLHRISLIFKTYIFFYNTSAPSCSFFPFAPPSISWLFALWGVICQQPNRSNDLLPQQGTIPCLLFPAAKSQHFLSISLNQFTWQVRRKIRGASGLYKESHKLLTWSGSKELALSTPANQLSFAVKPYTEVHLLNTVPQKACDLIPDDYIFRNLVSFFLLCLTGENLSFNRYMNIGTS